MGRVVAAPARTFGGSDDNELLGAYVPTLVLQWLRDRPAQRHRVIDGTLVFADISGFTRMTEMLAVRGKIGAEEMADLINATFKPLLDTAYGYGAGLLKWGGDAALLFFQGADHAVRGCRAAYEMQQVMRTTGSRRTSRGPVRLRMSVGIHSGPCDFFLLGRDDHRDLVVSGPAVTALTHLEQIAGPGQVVVSDGTVAALAAAGLQRPATALQEGWLLRRPPGSRTSAALLQPLDFAELDPGIALCRILREHVLGRGLESEHRHVAVGFLTFTGVDRLLREQGSGMTQLALDHVITTLQAAAAANEVTYTSADIGADGGKVLLCAGAPTRVGRDEDRMIATLRSALDAAGELSLGAGATSGRVFSGDYGPSYRRAYSLMGDCVNLAARLAQHAAPGELLATRELADNSSGGFAATEHPPFAAKGKRAPVHALSIGTPTAAGDGWFDKAPFQGRDEELATLLGAARAAADGLGQVVEVVGEPGIGKSRLLTELEAAADADVLRLDGDIYAGARPYAPFERLLRERWEIPATAPSAELAARLTQVVSARAPHLSQWLPLLAVVAGAEVDSTLQVNETDPAQRKQKLEEVTSEFLGVLLPGARIFIFNDVHLMDDASRDLIARLAADVGSRWWLLVLSRTPDSPSPLQEIPHDRVELGALGEAVVADMLAQATAESPLPPHRLTELAHRAGGNPLFVRALVAQLQTGADPDALPRSIEGAITMRIDRLSSADRHTLRSAAVLGMEVEVALLREVLAGEARDGSWDTDPLARLSEFLEPIAPDRYVFTHQLVRAVTYEGLPYRRRTDLHSRTAAAIERAAGEDANHHAELLSMHCFHGDRFAAAYAYARLAGQRARSRYANAEAAESYRRALASAARLAHVDGLVLAEVEEELAEIYVERGEMAAADVTLRRALRRVRDTPVRLARLQLKVAGLRETEARFRAAFRWAKQAEGTLEGLDGREVRVIRGQLATRRARLNYRRARYDEAMSSANIAIALSGDDDRPTLAEALEYADLCAVELGLPAGKRAEQALAIQEELGDLAAQARVQNTLGMLAYHRGEWPKALEHYAASERADIRCGKLWNAATPAANRAEILADQGRLEEARLALEKAMLTWRGVNAVSMIAFGEYELGRIAARLGDTREAMRRFDASRLHFSELGELTEVVVVDALSAEALSLAGDHEAALALADATLVRAEALGGVSAMTPLLQRVRGASLQALGLPAAAESALLDALDAARSRMARHEIAFALATLIDGAMADDDAEDEAWRAELSQLTDDLGIDPRPRWSRQTARA